MTEDQIMAKAEQLAYDELPICDNPIMHSKQFRRSLARHYYALKTAQATQPEPDPQLVKAMAVWDEARQAFSNAIAVPVGREEAACVIMSHYPGPDAELIEWARSGEGLSFSSPAFEGVRAFILKRAGETE